MVLEDPADSHLTASCEGDGSELHSDNEHELYPENSKHDSYNHDSHDFHISDSQNMQHIQELKDNCSVEVEIDNGCVKSLKDFTAEIDDNVKKPQDDNSGLLKAPDGGYGWVVCFGVFINHMIYGPVCGAVVSRYSVRTAFMIGTGLSFSGMLLNGYAPNIYFLFLSHTLLLGLGRGMMAGILLLNLYFDKHRSLATGLGSSGVGIGSLWVIPLTQYLFAEYNFSGAFMIISGLCLHGFVMAMLFRPLRLHYRFTKSKMFQKKNKPGNMEEAIPLTTDANSNFKKTEEEQDGSNMENSHFDALTDSENSKLKECLSTSEKQPSKEISNCSMSIKDSSDVIITAQPSTEAALTLTDGKGVVRSKPSKDDTCCESSLKICFPVEFKQQGTKKRKKAFHWDLLKHVPFMIFCFSNFLFILAFKTAFTFLPAIAMAKGLSQQEAALILTISGALDTFGRIATGFIMDFKPLRPLRPYFFNLLLFIIASASLLVPSLTTFASFSIVCAVYGFLTGAFIAQKMVVIVDILGRELMPSSLGIQKVFQGFGTLIGPPFAGALRDALGSYDSSFYLGGASMLGSGLLLGLSNVLLRIRNRNLNSQKQGATLSEQ